MAEHGHKKSGQLGSLARNHLSRLEVYNVNQNDVQQPAPPPLPPPPRKPTSPAPPKPPRLPALRSPPLPSVDQPQLVQPAHICYEKYLIQSLTELIFHVHYAHVLNRCKIHLRPFFLRG
ncbi:hypothetical protein M569_00934 [Genlisea aurea]|uniref:Uncharacterized protein n=1 Tax=Genlisea aurea TaxID=192259 RepID=S8ED11_9LAMI|nr:hypothetical protein M569_00934 [Genlisea aurea]